MKAETATPPRKSTATVAKAVGDSPKPASKAVAAAKPSTTTEKATTAGKTATAAKAGGAVQGSYWVQVGAFQDAGTAKRLAARLREQGFQVGESTTSAGVQKPAAAPAAAAAPGDRYDVVVSGAPVSEITAKLTAKGVTAEATDNGATVRPSLPLRDAVALSRELADAGLSVQVRRVGGPAPAAAPASEAAAAMFHRVRVGGFPDKATAMTAMKRLEEKGYKPFIARGSE
jgi:cell division protein FtsN